MAAVSSPRTVLDISARRVCSSGKMLRALCFLLLAVTLRSQVLEDRPKDRDVWPNLTVGSMVRLSDEWWGQLRYVGEHAGHRIVILTPDVGSAGPQQSLVVLKLWYGSYRPILTLPMLRALGGYQPVVLGDLLKIYLVREHRQEIEVGAEPLLSVDLSRLLNSSL